MASQQITTANDNDLRSKPIKDIRKQQTYFMNIQNKIKRQKQLDFMAIQIFKLEKQYYQNKKLFNDELSTMWQNHRNLVQDKGMTMTLINLIEQRLHNITNRWRERFYFRMCYYLIHPYGDWDAIDKNNNNSNSRTETTTTTIHNTIGFEPCLFIDTTKHLFNQQQLKFLSRGPTYVPPYQLHVSSLSLSKDDILRKQYVPLKRHLAWLFDKYKIDINLQFTIQNEIYRQFKQYFSMSLPEHRLKRAIYEKKLTHRIRDLMKKNNLILR